MTDPTSPLETPAASTQQASAQPDLQARLRRLQFRAWHRGTREADYMIGCYFDRFHAQWSEDQVAWFEALIEEDDVDIMAWALGTQEVPEEYRGVMMDAMRRLDYVDIPR
ncbi:MAG: succinate dehydrogenase assembly factor 2 [Novosphingobium meiothermophilum]